MFVVPASPVPKARPRVTRFGHTYTPQKTTDQENKIREAFLLEKWELTEMDSLAGTADFTAASFSMSSCCIIFILKPP